jgi:hypothetical protein
MYYKLKILIFTRHTANMDCSPYALSYILMCINGLIVHSCYLAVKFANSLQCAQTAQKQHDYIVENVL